MYPFAVRIKLVRPFIFTFEDERFFRLKKSGKPEPFFQQELATKMRMLYDRKKSKGGAYEGFNGNQRRDR